MSDQSHPLHGIRVITLAPNLPGPAAAARLVRLGATVTKVEAPAGDPMVKASPAYYARLTMGQQIVTLDLKDQSDRNRLWELLENADLLLTSSRPVALRRLGLGWPALHERLPRLSQVAIVGHPGEHGGLAGHDLTYQAGAGTLQPPLMPTVLVADLAGAERAAADGVAAVLSASRTGVGTYREVALSDVAADLAQPVQQGLTVPEGILGGGLPQYGLYESSDGHIALAALEPHFWAALLEQLGISGERPELEAIFRTRSSAEWQTWAQEHDLPLAAVRGPGTADAAYPNHRGRASRKTGACRSPWITEDLDDLRELARTFFERESVPHLERWAEQQQVDRELWNAAGAAGLLCISVPEEYGGGGGSFAHEAVVVEEQARAGDDAFGYSVHSTIVAHYVLRYGSEEQKRAWLPRLATGEYVGAIAMTEPGAGSDLQSLRTSARPDGGHYVVNGSKTFITNGSHANFLVLVVRTSEDEGGRGLSLLGVETDGLEGFSRGRVLKKVGMHGQDTRELFFDGVRVPRENLIGLREGMGFVQLMEQLPQERLVIAVSAVAWMEAVVRQTVDYAKERTAFGRELLEFQNTRFVLAECATETKAARTFVDHCIERHLSGELDAAGASMAKYLSTERQFEVTDRCLQVFGGYGYMMEYPIARAFAAARVQKIYGGTNEIMKELIARSL